MHPDIVAGVMADIVASGGSVVKDEVSDLLTINEEFTASLIVVRCQETAAGNLRWKIRLDQGLRPDITIAVRMAEGNAEARDYYLLPWIENGSDPSIRLAADNGVMLDAFRFDNLDPFYELARRTELRAA
jgi:hypothetical protein